MKPHILNVDDLDNNLTATAGLLADLEAEMILARNGREALLQMTKQEFAVVLLDAHMPDMDGFEVIKLMSSVNRTKTIPIIFMSAVFKDDQHALTGYDLGAVDYLVKPFPPAFLRAKVKVFLELYRQKEQIRSQEQAIRLFHNLLDESSDEILIFDIRTGLLIEANATAFQRLGLPREELIGEFHLEDCHLLIGADRDLETFLERLRGIGHLVVEGSYLDTQRQLHHTETNVQLLNQGDQTLILAMLRDVTERKQTELALSRAQADADKANQAKSDFLAAMSHEIRTPMNIIIGMGDVLMETTLTPQQRYYLSMLRNAGSNLLMLINDILDLSKVEANMLRIHEEPVQLRELAREVVEMSRVLANTKGLTLEARIDPALPEWIVADALRLRQCFYNLLSNAVKFTDEGWVVLDIGLNSENDGEMLVVVSDSGIGIQSEQLEAIFESFTQSDSGISRRYGGTGLGLSLTRRLLERMGGRIWVKSLMEKGSQFHFVIPLVAATTPLQGVECGSAPSPPEASEPPLKILLVEDVEENCELIRIYLEETPHLLQVVGNGAEAVERVKHEPFDIVLMDIEMPVMNGLTATARIRAWEAKHLNRPPIIILALSAHSMEGEARQCREAGCDDHLGKPISKKNLLAALRKHGQGRAAPAS
ncbi:MAG: response regulator [Magnetococcales bacterium]|nr:response regulator [Magnetococcales bacterium]